jgi:uncharacterized membrane protein
LPGHIHFARPMHGRGRLRIDWRRARRMLFLEPLQPVGPQPVNPEFRTMSLAWQYIKNGVQTGPVTTEELRNLLATGAIPAETLVWREGLASWSPASSLSEFAGTAPPVPPPTVTRPMANPGGPTPDATDVDKNKVFGILAYIGILWLVPLLAAKDSPFARYHTNQGLVLFLSSCAAWIAMVVLDLVLIFIPVLGVILITLLHAALLLSILVLAIIGIVNAANGICKPLPVIGSRFVIMK